MYPIEKWEECLEKDHKKSGAFKERDFLLVIDSRNPHGCHLKCRICKLYTEHCLLEKSYTKTLEVGNGHGSLSITNTIKHRKNKGHQDAVEWLKTNVSSWFMTLVPFVQHSTTSGHHSFGKLLIFLNISRVAFIAKPLWMHQRMSR